MGPRKDKEFFPDDFIRAGLSRSFIPEIDYRPDDNEWRHLKGQWYTDIVAARKKAAQEDKPDKRFPWGVWEADVPTSPGQFPALARMIYRGDVKEGEIISVRRVGPADLAAGRFSFSDKVERRGERSGSRSERGLDGPSPFLWGKMNPGGRGFLHGGGKIHARGADSRSLLPSNSLN